MDRLSLVSMETPSGICAGDARAALEPGREREATDADLGRRTQRRPLGKAAFGFESTSVKGRYESLCNRGVLKIMCNIVKHNAWCMTGTQHGLPDHQGKSGREWISVKAQERRGAGGAPVSKKWAKKQTQDTKRKKVNKQNKQNKIR